MLAIDIYNRIQKTWDEMSAFREEVVLAKLNKRVRDQAGFEDGQLQEMYNAVPDPHKDSFEDIEHNMDDLPLELQDRVRQRLREARRQPTPDSASAAFSRQSTKMSSPTVSEIYCQNISLMSLTLENCKGPRG
jgi:hypothetical protein